MAVQTTHAEYDYYLDQWKRCRDAALGQVAVHKAGEKYLPKLTGQTPSEYKSYLMRTTFYEATGRTIDGLSGMIFRKDPSIEEGGMSEFLLDVTLMDDSIRAFADDITKEVLTVGRVGVLVDYPQIDSEIITQAQAAAMNMRPFFKKYKAEAIINWKTERINNAPVLSEIRLMEVQDIEKTEFEYAQREIIRVLDIFEGKYRQRIFVKSNLLDKWVQEGDDIFPLMNGQPMGYVPFFFISQNGVNPDVEKPPLLGMVNMNLSHYITTAQREHAAFFTGSPTAVVTGISAEDADSEFKIGSTTAWAFSNPDAKAFFLEFTGQGVQTLKDLMTEKEAAMAALGAQMLSPQTRRNEAVETAAMRYTGEHSVLASLSIAISEGLNKALEVAADWMGVQKADIKLNKDFMPTPLTPQMMSELVKSWQAGAISMQTLFDNFKQGEIIAHDRQMDEELADIQDGVGIAL